MALVPSEIDDLRERRIAQTESNRRRVNEAIERGSQTEPLVCFCECGQLGCTAKLELSHGAYEHVRTDMDQFLLIPGHEIDEVEDVVERHDGYLVVKKKALDP